jgi:hypothetical protein
MPVTTVVNPLAGDESRALSRKIGRWTSLGSLGFGLLYLVGVGVNLSTSGSVYLSGRDVRTVSAAVALLWNLALIVLFVTLRREAEPSRTVLAELALAFAVLVCGVSSVSWFIGLSAQRPVQQVDPAVAELTDPAGVFLVAEIGDVPAGYARLREAVPTAALASARPIEIVRLYARTPWIGRGVGAALTHA